VVPKPFEDHRRTLSRTVRSCSPISKDLKDFQFRLTIGKMIYTSRSASWASLLLLISLSALVVPNLSKVVVDYRVPLSAKVADLDDPASVMGNRTFFKIMGENSVTESYEFQKTPNGKFQSITFKINDKSIFLPDNDPKKAQVGFRRNDLLPKYDPKALEVGKKTYHHSFIFKEGLNKTHGYLLASVEFPKENGAHMFDLHWGNAFRSENIEGKLSPDANKIKLRDINFETLFSVDMVIGKVFNFAVEIDWDKKYADEIRFSFIITRTSGVVELIIIDL